MIIVKLLGGLGNQMFQYAAGLALAEHHRTVLKLDVEWFRHDDQFEAHNRYALSCFQITEQFATAEEIRRCRGFPTTRTERWTAALAEKLRLYHLANFHKSRGRWHTEDRPRGDPGFAGLPDSTYLDGMFQSEKFFSRIAGLLRMHFSLRYPATPEVEALAARIRSGPSIALHFRRGDYVRNPSFACQIGSLGLDYHRRALRRLRERSPGATAYIFSDDIESVARDFQPDGPHEFVRCVEPWHPWDNIRLMSLCNHQATANSTLSWWSAWLNPSPDKLIIAPEPWFADTTGMNDDIVPAPWTRLARETPA
jgi:hypothetical protein